LQQHPGRNARHAEQHPLLLLLLLARLLLLLLLLLLAWLLLLLLVELRMSVSAVYMHTMQMRLRVQSVSWQGAWNACQQQQQQ
jgi:hypothetical protein